MNYLFQFDISQNSFELSISQSLQYKTTTLLIHKKEILLSAFDKYL